MGRLYLFGASVSVLALLFCSSVCAIGPYELPFGVYTTRDDIIMDSLDVMRDSLGINFIYGQVSTSNMQTIRDEGLEVIYWGNDYQGWLSGTTYFIAQAEDNTNKFDFLTRNGTSTNGFLVSSAQGIMLDNLIFNQYYNSGRPWSNAINRINIRARLTIDTTGLNDTSLIGVIYAKRHEENGSWIDRAIDSIFAGSLDTLNAISLISGDTLIVIGSQPYFTLCDQGDCNSQYEMKYSFWNSGRTTVSLDYLKFYDSEGGLLKESNYFDDSIKVAVQGAWQNQVNYWWLRDEPKFDYFSSWGKTDSIVNYYAFGDPIGALCLTCVKSIYDTAYFRPILDDFYEKTHQNRLIHNSYPYYGGYGNWGYTDYSGYYEDYVNGKQVRGLQMAIQALPQKELEAFRAAAERHPGFEFWYSPQWMYSAGSDNESDPPATRYIWRPPTRSELRMQIWLGLCYGTRGFNLWRYDFGNSDPGQGTYPCSGQNICSWQGGFYDSTASEGVHPDTMYWNLCKHEIMPVIKAIDSTYLGLTWQRAYPLCDIPETTMTPPAGAYISSIHGWSDSPNPDTSWAQVGEFSSGGDNYILLVNRACSSDDQGTEAPPQHFMLNLDPGSIGSDYVLITDLADSLRHAGGDTGWVGIPKTTYSAKMPDGTILYTVTLIAGEGKLIKIIGIDSIPLNGTVNTDYIYQGRIKVIGDVSVPSSHTLQLKGPARFEIYRCDPQSGGYDPALIEWTIGGKLVASGTATDSILFRPDTTYDCDTMDVYPQPGDWVDITDYIRALAEREQTNYSLVATADLLGDSNFRLSEALGDALRDRLKVRLIYK